MTKQLKISVNHRSSIPGARWCTPVGWEPANEINGAEFLDGSWWSDHEEEAGIVYFGEASDGDEIEVSPNDLRVASTGDCRVIGRVEV